LFHCIDFDVGSGLHKNQVAESGLTLRWTFCILHVVLLQRLLVFHMDYTHSEEYVEKIIVIILGRVFFC